MIEGKAKILITGAGQGIGRALARNFAEKGHKIYLLDIDKDALEHTVKVHLKQYTDHIAWSVCNLRDTDEIRSTIKKAADYLGGRIDFLINNAGISSPYWPDEKSMADPETLDVWKTYVDVNMTGNFATSQACIPYMKVEKDEDIKKLPGSVVGKAGPCILNVSSFRGVVSDPNQDGYAATKGKSEDLSYLG